MSLAEGIRLGPYEIRALIGEGGMGEVYRAFDPRLGRAVAIKLSAAQFTERFDREARAVAALNHPNICHLYDVGPNYLVMELVDGDAPNGPMPLETALRQARQIIDALEAAHDKGIIHRDLKPGNIKVTPDGTVKVLDFGLAKMAPAASSENVSATNSPTISMAATNAGVILGTAAYMSPEQARGEPVDQRADIWAFGVILYEMLTGMRTFEGRTISDTLAAVLIKEPDLERVSAPGAAAAQALSRKRTKQRLHHAADVRLMLEQASAPIDDATPVAGAAATRSRFGLVASIVAAVLGVALTIDGIFCTTVRPRATTKMRESTSVHWM
jgi:serine/threonine protein kinase